MALLNFLYKDEAFIASLYAQIFHGKLIQVAMEQADTKTLGKEMGAGVTVVSGKIQGGETTHAARTDTIDPHDAVTLDVLSHLSTMCVEEDRATPSSIVMLGGGLFLIPYELRKIIVDVGFEANQAQFLRSLGSIPDKKNKNKILEYAKKRCVGEPEEIRFFFCSDSGIWYWGTLQKQYIIALMETLQLTYGVEPIPVSMMAVYLGDMWKNTGQATTDPADLPVGMVRCMNGLTSMTNTVFATGVTDIRGSLAPVTLSQNITGTQAS